jgi:hypothetical protein
VVVASGEQAQVVGGGDGCGVGGEAVANSSGVFGDGSLLDIVATLSTDEETLMAKDSIEVGRWALEQVEESTGVEVWLLEEEVDLGTLGLRAGQVLGQDLGLKALGNVVVELKLGVKSVTGGPGLGEGEA